MKRQLLYYTVSVVLLAVCGSLYGQQAMKINTKESKINWTGKKPAKEHKGTIKLRDGDLIVQNNEITGGSFIIDMKSLVNADLKDDSGNKMVNQLKSPEFFDVKNFPTAKYVITNVERINNAERVERKATHRIQGELTMKGVTKKVSFDASINFLNGKFTASTPLLTINKDKLVVNDPSDSDLAELREVIEDDISLTIDLVSE